MAKTYKIVRRGRVKFRAAAKCIFCDFAGPLTGEHIFSKWTHRFLPPRSMVKYRAMRAETYVNKSDPMIFKRAGDIRDWKIDCVCEARCNNGWMRQKIENVARPIMIPLISGAHIATGAPIRLSVADQKIIAAWATLKAMVAEFDSIAYVTTHHTQRKKLMRTLEPPKDGWAVWIGHYVRMRWKPHWGSSPFLYHTPKQERRRTDVRATYYNSHISTQVIGQLFIHVIRSPARGLIERWRFSPPHKGSLFRIWPPSGHSINWPGTTMSDADADYMAGALKTWLEDRGRVWLERAIAQGNPPPGADEAMAAVKDTAVLVEKMKGP